MTRETESNCALRWTNLGNAHREQRERKRETEEKRGKNLGGGVGWGFKTKKKTSRGGEKRQMHMERCGMKEWITVKEREEERDSQSGRNKHIEKQRYKRRKDSR